MSEFFDQFPLAIRASVLCVGATLLAAGLVAGVAVRRGRDPVEAAARALFCGTALSVLIATVVLRGRPHLDSSGDLVWRIGRGGLRDWRVIFRAPDSLAAVLLLGNLVLLAPLAFFGRLGWPARSVVILVACLGLSATIELVQALLLGRVGATDDWLLNAVGVVLGLAVADLVLRCRERGSGRREGA